MRTHLGCLRDNSNVNVGRYKSFICNNFYYPAQEHPRIGALPAYICIREVLSYVAKSRSTKKGIRKGMESDIGITMPEQTFFVGDIDTADDTTTAFDEAVNIETVSDTEGTVHNY